ncbi:SDR family oxidoreductase [Sphingobium chungbukense]|uniref:SDR family oxidoreductase n=1 Tax=Sphingobium chungbukense TaxID=56193 RepID=UPI000A8FEA60
MKIVIIGGTGLIGQPLVGLLSAEGHEVVAASPSTGIDALTGAGLAQALTDAAAVVDVSNAPSFEDEAALAFFRSPTTNLLEAARHAGVRHVIALSVVASCSPDPQPPADTAIECIASAFC